MRLIDPNTVPLSVRALPADTDMTDPEQVWAAVEGAPERALGHGLLWGKGVCEIEVVRSKQPCVVFDEASQTVLWVIQPSDFTVH